LIDIVEQRGLMKFLRRLQFKQHVDDLTVQYVKQGPKDYLLVGEQYFDLGGNRPNNVKPTLECSNLELKGSINYGLQNQPKSPLISAEACLKDFSFTEFGSNHLKYSPPASAKQDATVWIHQSPEFSKEIKPPFFSVQAENKTSNTPLLFQFFPTASDFENLWQVLESGVVRFSISLSFYGVSTVYSAYQHRQDFGPNLRARGLDLDLDRHDIKCFNAFSYANKKLYFRQIVNFDAAPDNFLKAEHVHFGQNFQFDWAVKVL
jgi:hypothetical protein